MQKKLKAVAIICEYNPFHYGHKHQIEVVKQQFDVVIGVMSGAFVQRGNVAVADKYSRASAAIDGGMDLVVELPFPYCLAAAPDFARAGVIIANAVAADALAFGCEDKGETVQAIAALIASEEVQKKAAEMIKSHKSLSFPKALQASVKELAGEEAAIVISKPNNILAAEYISAIQREGLELTALPIIRDMSYLSSTEIRKNGSYKELLPYPAYFLSEQRKLKYAERLIISSLRDSTYKHRYGVDQTLYSHIKKAANAACDIESVVELAVNKVYTAARIRRAMLAIWLDISESEVKTPPCYTNVLAANEKGKEYLNQIRKEAKLTIITKPADYKKRSETVTAFEKALYAEEKAALCGETIKPYGHTLKFKPVIK